MTRGVYAPEVVITPGISIDVIGSIRDAILAFDNRQVAADCGLVTLVEDPSKALDYMLQEGLDRRAFISNVLATGRRDLATHLFKVHGVLAVHDPLITPTPKSVTVVDSQFSNFTGDGLHIVQRNQLHVRDSKFTTNKGFGVYLDHVDDSKLVVVGMGRNEAGQFYATNCSSYQILGFDIWNPPSISEAFTFQSINCGKSRLINGEIEGRLLFTGNNQLSSATARREQRNNVISNCHIKVDSFNAAPAGEGQLVLLDLDGMKLVATQFGFSHGGPDSGEVTATPDFSIELRNASTTADGCEVELVGVSFFQNNKDGSVPPVPAFKKHWCNRPLEVVWRNGPGTIVFCRDSCKPVNSILMDGSVKNKADYPLLYLALDSSRLLTDVATTFTLPAAPTGISLPANHNAYLITR